MAIKYRQPAQISCDSFGGRSTSTCPNLHHLWIKTASAAPAVSRRSDRSQSGTRRCPSLAGPQSIHRRLALRPVFFLVAHVLRAASRRRAGDSLFICDSFRAWSLCQWAMHAERTCDAAHRTDTAMLQRRVQHNEAKRCCCAPAWLLCARSISDPGTSSVRIGSDAAPCLLAPAAQC